MNKYSVELLLKQIGHNFNDVSLIKQALTHRSLSSKNNERLEYLGDSILSFVISEALYERYPKASEGQLTRMRSSLVKGDTLAEISAEFGVEKYLLLSKGELRTGGAQKTSIQADALEAIIAAIFLDAGIEKTKNCILSWFATRLDVNLMEEVSKDPKSQLQEYLQARKLAVPEYKVIHSTGDAHEQVFSVSCNISLLSEAIIGTGSSRRRAEQEAASKVIEQLKNVKK